MLPEAFEGEAEGLARGEWMFEVEGCQNPAQGFEIELGSNAGLGQAADIVLYRPAHLAPEVIPLFGREEEPGLGWFACGCLPGLSFVGLLLHGDSSR
jgi:hypothetical protein